MFPVAAARRGSHRPGPSVPSSRFACHFHVFREADSARLPQRTVKFFFLCFFLHATLNFVDDTCKGHSWAGCKLVFFLKKWENYTLLEHFLCLSHSNFVFPPLSFSICELSGEGVFSW